MKKLIVAGLAVLTLTATVLGGTALAGRHGRNAVVSDPKDSGKLYDASSYAACDIREVKAQVKRRKTLVVKTTLRGKQDFPNVELYLNERGSKRSTPEYIVWQDGATKIDGINKAGEQKNPKFIENAATVKLQDHGRSVRYDVKLKKIGGPKKVGFQAKTCGEGAVDIAPGKNYFDDTKWTGKIDYQYKNIKVG